MGFWLPTFAVQRQGQDREPLRELTDMLAEDVVGAYAEIGGAGDRFQPPSIAEISEKCVFLPVRMPDRVVDIEDQAARVVSEVTHVA